MTGVGSGHMRGLAIDIGTSSTRAMLLDRHGDFVGAGFSVPHDTGFRRDLAGSYEAASFLDAVRQVVVEAHDGGPVDYIGISGFWHSIMAVDERLQPLTPALAWNFREASPFAARFKQRIDPRTYHRTTGCFPHSSYPPAKVLWLLERYELPDDVRLIDLPSWIWCRLTGQTEALTSLSQASGYGVMSLTRGQWDPAVIDAMQIGQGLLPSIVRQPAPLLDDVVCRQWSDLRGTPVVPPFGDGACNSVGSGGLRPDTVTIMVATSGSIRALEPITSADDPPARLWMSLVDERWCAFGCPSSTGGNLFEWLRKTLRLPHDLTHFEDRPVVPSTSLRIVPFIAGQRGPHFDEAATLTITGVTESTTPEDLYREAIVSLALFFSLLWDDFEEARPHTSTAILAGSAVDSSPVRQQSLADALGRPLQVSSFPEASARGAGLLARSAVGGPDIQDAKPDLSGSRTVEPDQTRYNQFRAAKEHLLSVYTAIRDQHTGAGQRSSADARRR